MNAPLARVIARMFARRPGDRPPQTRTRLRVEGLEAREVPAVYWVGDVSTDARDGENWYPIGVPSGNDNVFFYGLGAAGNFGYIDRDGDGIYTPRIPGNDCFGLTGDWKEVRVELDYEGTITLGATPSSWYPGDPLPDPAPTPYEGAGVSFWRLGMDAPDANIAQYHPVTGEVTSITITGEEDPYLPPYVPTALTWVAGSINDTPVPSTVTVTGATALISAMNGAVTLGSALVFDNEAEAEMQGEVNTPHPTGVDVLGGSVLALGSGLSLLSGLSDITERQTIRVSGETSRLFSRGAATVNMGLWVNGGRAEIQGVATGQTTVSFRGAVKRVDGTYPPTMGDFIGGGPGIISAYMTSGHLIIGEGGRLDLGGTRVLSIRGGTLSTRVIAGRTTHDAFITAGWVYVEQAPGATTEIMIGDPLLYPGLVGGPYYCTLEVTGSVDWMAGTYRPFVDPAGSLATLWYASTWFRFSESTRQGGAVPTIEPASGLQNPPVNSSYDVIRVGLNNLQRQLSPVIGTTTTANWSVLPKPPGNAADLALYIKRIP